jgi:hypothetical protein
VNNWYGKEERTVETVSDTASWHSTGFLPAVLLRWVLIRDPQVSHRRHARLRESHTRNDLSRSGC